MSPSLVPSWRALLPQLRQAADARRFHHHVSMNANKLSRMKRDPALAAAVEGAHSRAADGVVAVVGSVVQGRGLPSRIAGCDLGWRLLEEAAVRGWSVALVGARAEVVGALGVQLVDRSVNVVYLEDGYDPDEDAVISRIRAASPQLVLAALGTPKAECLLHRAQLPALCLGVGGGFDVWTGAVPRAPVWAQQVGLEGVIRVAREPRKRLGPFLRAAAGLVGGGHG